MASDPVLLAILDSVNIHMQGMTRHAQYMLLHSL